MYEKRIQTSMDKTANNLHYEIKFEICVKDKKKLAFLLREALPFFFKQKCILFLETYFFKTRKSLIASA